MLENILQRFNKKEIKPSAEVLNGRINYSFLNGLKAYQEQLNLEQDIELSKIFSDLMGVEVSSAVGNPSGFIQDIFKKLNREKRILSILKIILIQEDGSEIQDDKLLSLKNSEIENICMDFFSLNPTLISWLKTIGKEVISMMMMKSTKNTEAG